MKGRRSKKFFEEKINIEKEIMRREKEKKEEINIMRQSEDWEQNNAIIKRRGKNQRSNREIKKEIKIRVIKSMRAGRTEKKWYIEREKRRKNESIRSEEGDLEIYIGKMSEIRKENEEERMEKFRLWKKMEQEMNSV